MDVSIERFLERQFVVNPKMIQVLGRFELVENRGTGCLVRLSGRRLEIDPDVMVRTDDKTADETICTLLDGFGSVISDSRSCPPVPGCRVLLDLDTLYEEIEGYGFHEFCALNQDIFRFLGSEKAVSIDMDTAYRNICGYFGMLTDRHRAAAAHFTSLYTGPGNDDAVHFIAKQFPALTQSMIIYFRGIQL